MKKIISLLLTLLLKGLVYSYRYGFKAFIPQKCCRFTPSCSQYALNALEVYGPFKGTALSITRLSRCHPWGNHGYDPVIAPHKNEDKGKSTLS